jgi:hypothetical protein
LRLLALKWLSKLCAVVAHHAALNLRHMVEFSFGEVVKASPSRRLWDRTRRKTTRSIRALINRAAHMGHGSSVTYNRTKPGKPPALEPFGRFIDSQNSACASGFLWSSRRLYAFAMVLPPRTISAPTRHLIFAGGLFGQSDGFSHEKCVVSPDADYLP